jgi:hypothetical protein
MAKIKAVDMRLLDEVFASPNLKASGDDVPPT